MFAAPFDRRACSRCCRNDMNSRINRHEFDLQDNLLGGRNQLAHISGHLNLFRASFTYDWLPSRLLEFYHNDYGHTVESNSLC